LIICLWISSFFLLLFPHPFYYFIIYSFAIVIIEPLYYYLPDFIMAEPIGIASGVAGLATVAFQAGTTLYNTIKSYQSHQQTVLDLLEENGALNSVLGSINKTIALSTALDLSALEFPLQRCGQVCQEFNEEIDKLASLSGGKRARLLSWAKLRYMGEDIDGFRRLLAGYKMMINIALADATL
jgi:hypothetical protein